MWILDGLGWVFWKIDRGFSAILGLIGQIVIWVGPIIILILIIIIAWYFFFFR